MLTISVLSEVLCCTGHVMSCHDKLPNEVRECTHVAAMQVVVSLTLVLSFLSPSSSAAQDQHADAAGLLRRDDRGNRATHAHLRPKDAGGRGVRAHRRHRGRRRPSLRQQVGVCFWSVLLLLLLPGLVILAVAVNARRVVKKKRARDRRDMFPIPPFSSSRCLGLSTAQATSCLSDGELSIPNSSRGRLPFNVLMASPNRPCVSPACSRHQIRKRRRPRHGCARPRGTLTRLRLDPKPHHRAPVV